jgi:hypothetical protein
VSDRLFLPPAARYPAAGTGSARHGVPVRSIAQHLTSSFLASATTAGFFRVVPPAVSRA